jgi:hypothetical protein
MAWAATAAVSVPLNLSGAIKMFSDMAQNYLATGLPPQEKIAKNN